MHYKMADKISIKSTIATNDTHIKMGIEQCNISISEDRRPLKEAEIIDQSDTQSQNLGKSILLIVSFINY